MIRGGEVIAPGTPLEYNQLVALARIYAAPTGCVLFFAATRKDTASGPQVPPGAVSLCSAQGSLQASKCVAFSIVV